ncbi:DUF6804 family protein [Microbacterium sp. cf332]|uniref:DUF6804 family protein n=1 Tax=Microbacterium sp. cf332 TaxID=1761804 RepID=UPI00088BCF00|nr:DUF6804 family protein [Microbacterium sp. cf332]SDQ47719.1 hypothetical protein SAMN04487847_1555 [Microbacterium sp. cf332]
MASRSVRPAAQPQRQRNALAPGILGAAALIAGIPLIGGEFAMAVSFVVAILALIIAWFAVQARQWWWALPMVAVAVLWNPVVPVALDDAVWVAAHVVGAATFIAAGALVWVPRAVVAR